MTSFDWIQKIHLLDGKGGSQILNKSDVSLKQWEGVLWLHLDSNLPETGKWLLEESGLDPLSAEALLAEETRPRVLELGDDAVVIFRGVNLNEQQDPQDMLSLRIYVSPNRIISVRSQSLSAMSEVEKSLQKGNGPKSSGEFIALVADILCDRMEPLVAELTQITDALEDDILRNGKPHMRPKIVHVRQQATIFHRYLGPQRDVMVHLYNSHSGLFNAKERRYVQETTDRLIRYLEDLNMLKDRAKIVQEELSYIVSERLNLNIYIFSLVATVFMPLGFLTDLFGTNFTDLPLKDSPDGFIILCGILSVAFCIQVALFKRFTWF